MLRLIAPALLALLAAAACAADGVAVASAIPAACTPVASEQVPAPAKAALVSLGADAAKISSCTKDGIVRYCATVTGPDGAPIMVEVDASGALANEPQVSCGACCPADAH